MPKPVHARLRLRRKSMTGKKFSGIPSSSRREKAICRKALADAADKRKEEREAKIRSRLTLAKARLKAITAKRKAKEDDEARSVENS